MAAAKLYSTAALLHIFYSALLHKFCSAPHACATTIHSFGPGDTGTNMEANSGEICTCEENRGNFGGGKGRMGDIKLGCGCLRCIPVVVCEDIDILVIMSRDDSDDDLFFGRSRAEELSAVTVRELGRSCSSSSQSCLSSRAAELSACRSRDQLTKLPTDTAAWLHS